MNLNLAAFLACALIVLFNRANGWKSFLLRTTSISQTQHGRHTSDPTAGNGLRTMYSTEISGQLTSSALSSISPSSGPVFTSLTDDITRVDAVAFKPKFKYDTDSFGMINFCLRSSDTRMSGPSRSKILNDITNEVFKAIMIGFEPLIQDVLSKFPSYRAVLEGTPCVLDVSKQKAAVLQALEDKGRPTAALMRGDETFDASERKPGSSANNSFRSEPGTISDTVTLISPNNQADSVIILSDSIQTPQLKQQFRPHSQASSDATSLSVAVSPVTEPAAAQPAATVPAAASAVPAETCDIDLSTAIRYMSYIEALLRDGTRYEAVLGGSSIYDRGYKRLLTYLKDSGCKFAYGSSASTSTAPLTNSGGNGGSADDASSSPGNDGTAACSSSSGGEASTCNSGITPHARPIPSDSNICLSIMDLRFPGDIMRRKSKTLELNRVSNIVGRAVVYGTKRDQTFIADRITDSLVPQFAETWTNGDLGTQEVVFLRVLALLLRDGLRAATAASTFIQGLDVESKEGGYRARATAPSLPNSISNRYPQSPSSAVLNPNSSRSGGSINSSSDNIVSTISSRRLVDPDSAESSSSSSSSGTAAEEEDHDIPPPSHQLPSLRLFDTYQNAFQRVVEMCVLESTTSSSQAEEAQNEAFLYSFLEWERDLRSNLTEDLWKKNPQELVGTWDLIDLQSTGPLKSLMSAPSADISAALAANSVSYIYAM